MDISMMLPYLDQFPHAKLLVNYRGYGLSTGSPTEQAIMGDSLAILDDVLKETGRTPDDVILVGQSLGSGVATQIASVRNVKNWYFWFPLTACWRPPGTSSPTCPSSSFCPTTSVPTWRLPKSPAPSASWRRDRMKSFLRLMPSGCATASPLPSTIRNSLGLCTTPSGTAQDLTGHSPKASVTEPDYEREARETLRKHSPACSSSSQEASSGNASGNRLAHSTTSTASPSRYSSQPIPKSSDSSRSR